MGWYIPPAAGWYTWGGYGRYSLTRRPTHERPQQLAKLRRERYAWEYLRGLKGVLTPEVIALEADETLLGLPYLIMTHLPGRSMAEVFPTLSLGERLVLLEELGALAHAIHALDIDLAALPAEMFPWTGHREDMMFQLRDLAERGWITAAARAKVERLVQRYAWQLATMDEDIVFLHGDLFFANILLRRDRGRWRISGLVDAELAGAGPRGRELRALRVVLAARPANSWSA